MNEIVIFQEVTAVQAYTKGAMNPLLEKIEEAAKSFVHDLTTAKGRKEVASFAHKIAQSKTHLDTLGKKAKADAQATVKAVDAERKIMRDRLDKLKEEVRQPLTDFEEAEKKRIAELHERVESIRWMVPTRDADGNLHTSGVLKDGLAGLKALVIDESFGDKVNDAALAKEQTITAVEQFVAEREEHEQQQVELERLRKEAEEQKQREYDERIRREAEEKAKREAEEAARKEKDRVEAERAAAEQKAKAEREKAEREKAEAEAALIREKEEAKRKEAEAERKVQEAEMKRLADIQSEKDRAEKEKIAAEEKRLADIKAEREKAEKEKAEILRKQAEKELAATAAKEAEKAEEKKRQQDEDHRRKINNNILSSIEGIGVNQDLGKKLISAIVKGQVPHVSIGY